MTARALVLSALADGPSTIDAPAARPRHRADGRRAARARASVSTPSTTSAGRSARPAARPGAGRRRPGRHGDALRAAGRRAGRRARSPSTATRTPATARCGPLSKALRALGVSIDASPTGGLPLTVHGTGRVAGGEVGHRRLRVQPVRLRPAAGRAALRPRASCVRHEGPPVPSAPHLRMTTAHAARGRRGGRRQRARRLGGRARPAVRPRLGHRAGPVRRRAVLRRRAGHRRRGHPGRLAAHAAGSRSAGCGELLPRWAAR